MWPLRCVSVSSVTEWLTALASRNNLFQRLEMQSCSSRERLLQLQPIVYIATDEQSHPGSRVIIALLELDHASGIYRPLISFRIHFCLIYDALWIYSHHGVSYFTFSYNSSRPLSHIIVFGMMNNLKYEYLTYSRSVSNDFYLCQILAFIFISWFAWTIQTLHTVLSELKNLRQGALNAVDTVLFIKSDVCRTGPRSLLNRFRLHWNKAIFSVSTNGISVRFRSNEIRWYNIVYMVSMPETDR